MDRDAVVEPPRPSGSMPATGIVPRFSTDMRVQLVLCQAMFLAVINFAGPAPFLPRIARDLGASVPLLGQVTTATTLISAALGLVVGPLADRYGSRRLIVGGTVAVGINLLGIGFARSYAMLLALAVIGGLGDAALFGLPLAIAGTHFAGEARRRVLGWTSAAIPLGAIAGVPLMAGAGAVVEWRVVFIGVGAVTLVASRLAAAWLPPDRPEPGERLNPRTLTAAYRPLWRHSPLRLLYAAGGLRFICWIGFVTYLGAFLSDERGLGAGGVGLAFLTAGCGSFLGSLIGGRITRVAPRLLAAVTTLGQGVLLGAALVLPLDRVATLALFPVATCLGSIGFVALTSLLAAESPGGAATTMVLNGSILNLGAAVAGAVGGLLLALGDYRALGLGLPLFAVAAAVVLCWSARSPRPAERLLFDAP